MHFDTLALAFPLVLAAHNLEEYTRDSTFLRRAHPALLSALTERRIVRNALILLTTAAAILVLWNYRAPSPVRRQLCAIAILALLLNATGHFLLSLKRRHVLPGTLSAVLLIFPYSACAIYLLHTAGESLASLLSDTMFSAITLIVAIPLFLSLGYITGRKRRTHLK